MGLWSRQSVAELERRAALDGGLKRELGLFDLSLMGIGGTIGAGIFVLTGTAAAQYAGPAVSLSFVLAGLVCLCAALCYAELASMIPVSGSAYTYAYATLGEFIAWIIGWNLILEYLFAASTVAVGWSGYFGALLSGLGLRIPAALATAPFQFDAAGGFAMQPSINLPAIAIVLLMTLLLHGGVRQSARANAAMVVLKVGVILLVIAFGSMFVRPENWRPFVPANTGVSGQFGWSGVVRAAGVVFYAYVGFDMVSSSAQEAVRPKRDIPLAILFALAVCTALYVAMALVMTGLAPFRSLNVAHPVYVAVDAAGAALAWLKPWIAIAAVVGLASAILVTLYGQTRILYAMARDGLVPPAFGAIDPRRNAPIISTWWVGVVAAVVAGLLPIEVLGELVSIGTLLAFAVVCIGVAVLRLREPAAARGFRAPWLMVVAPLGAASCVYLMWSLPEGTWIRFAVWMTLGLLIYFTYSRKRSLLAGGRKSTPLSEDTAHQN